MVNRERIIDVIESSFAQLTIIFVALVFLRELGHTYRINLTLFAYTLALFGITTLISPKKRYAKKMPNIILIALFLFSIIFLARLLPFRENETPLGYDPGIYRYIMGTYKAGLPHLPEESLPLWVRAGHPQGLFILTSVTETLANVGPDLLLLYLFPFLCALLVLPIFVLAKNLFDEEVAIIASILYAVSYTQYTMFTFMYFKNVVGLIFLLLALYSLEKKDYVTLTLMYSALGIYHRPEFLLFSMILVPYFVLTRERKIVYSTIATALLISPFWLPRLEIYWELATGITSENINRIVAGTPTGGGTFFDYARYEWVSLAYLPFALIGFLYLAIKKRYNSLFFYFLINTSIVIFKLVFYRRFIISLDLLFIILAAAGLNYALLQSRKVPIKIGYLAVALLIISSGILTFNLAVNAKPLIRQNDLDTIRWLDKNIERDAYIMAPSNFAPWVLGYSNKKVIAPGLFQYDKNTEEEWYAFFYNKDLDETKRFLSNYGRPLYIYMPKRFGGEKFENECFEEVRLIVLRYVC